jgi:hypothetical protein
MENRKASREKYIPFKQRHYAVGDVWVEEGRGSRLYWTPAPVALQH